MSKNSASAEKNASKAFVKLSLNFISLSGALFWFGVL
jgi:hypothetical protein